MCVYSKKLILIFDAFGVHRQNKNLIYFFETVKKHAALTKYAFGG